MKRIIIEVPPVPGQMQGIFLEYKLINQGVYYYDEDKHPGFFSANRKIIGDAYRRKTCLFAVVSLYIDWDVFNGFFVIQRDLYEDAPREILDKTLLEATLARFKKHELEKFLKKRQAPSDKNTDFLFFSEEF